MRARRRAIKEFVKTSSSRVETKLFDRLYNELIDLTQKKGLTLKKKRDFYAMIQSMRASVEVIKRKKRRKRVNRF